MSEPIRAEAAPRATATRRSSPGMQERRRPGAGAAPSGSPDGWQDRRAYTAVKRTFDIVAALALLALVVPAALVLLAPLRRGWWPRLTSIECAGRDGRPFPLRRESVAPPASPYGRALARSSLTHWPTLVSIVEGHLSFVGPRLLDAATARALPPRDLDRQSVLPGLFCYRWLEQRANIDFDSEAHSDRRYLHERSLRTDLSILMRSLLAMPYGAANESAEPVVHIGGIRLLNLGMDELVTAIDAAVAARVRTQVAFVNPACVNIAAVDPVYRAALARADWVCPDGIGMKIAGRILKRAIRQNLNGTDLFPRLCADAARRGHRIFLLGARAGVADAVARFAEHAFPGLQVVGTQSGYFETDDEDEVIAAIRASGADILLVAMGVPQQDLWLRRNLRRSGASVGIGVGGLFDFYGGRIPRAPLWLREIGGEWLYRLLQEPRRMWRRYLIGNVVFMWRIVRERMTLAASADKAG